MTILSNTVTPPIDRKTVKALCGRLQTRTGAAVHLSETHLSWVILTDSFAYKIKKQIRLPFVDFSTLARRKHFCEEEVRLNQRLAQGLYLSVVPVVVVAATPDIEVAGVPIDYAVKMRRFPDGALLSEVLERGELSASHVTRLAGRIADFHGQASTAPPTSPFGTVERIVRDAESVIEQLAAFSDPLFVTWMRQWLREQASLLRDTWLARKAGGWVRECHGDLHLGNAVLLDDDVTPFDCIEFDPGLSVIDVLADIAFLTMDLKAHGRDDLAFAFLDVYLQQTGDYAGLVVHRYYEVYRALIRALVGRLGPTTSQRLDTCAAVDYAAAARRIADSARPCLLITFGFSGSGKSTVAEQLAQAAGAIRIRSDVERKRLYGLRPLQHSPTGVGSIYGTEANRRTHDRLLQCADIVLSAGHPVIVDATFLRKEDRTDFRRLAGRLGVPYTILHCQVDEAHLRSRLRDRSMTNADASEADDAVLQTQRRSFDPLSADEAAFTLEVDTLQAIDARRLAWQWHAMTTLRK